MTTTGAAVTGTVTPLSGPNVITFTNRSTESLSFTRSSSWKPDRPAATATNGSGDTASGHEAGRATTRPFVSWKYTRCSPHACP